MAKDDMFKIIYCILQELYACKKQGVRVNKSDIGWERFCIPYSYWLDIMIEMQDKGYVMGVMYHMTKGTGRAASYDDVNITLEGAEYLEDNSMMKKVREALKDLKDIVPGF